MNSGGQISEKCFSLKHNHWVQEANLLMARTKAGASSSHHQMIITGGASNEWNRMKTTEIYSHGIWSSGPKLDQTLIRHCQVEVNGAVYVIGINAHHLNQNPFYCIQGVGLVAPQTKFTDLIRMPCPGKSYIPLQKPDICIHVLQWTQISLLLEARI